MPFVRKRSWPGRLRLHALQGLDDLVPVAQQFGPVQLPLPLQVLEQALDARPPVGVLPGEVSACEDRPEVRGQEDAHRPAAMAARVEHRSRHVDFIQVRTLLAVHLDRHEVSIERLRDRRVFERLPLHDVAPVAGGVADAQEDQLVLAARAGQRFLAPRIPVHGILGVLRQVGAGFAFESIGHVPRW